MKTGNEIKSYINLDHTKNNLFPSDISIPCTRREEGIKPRLIQSVILENSTHMKSASRSFTQFQTKDKSMREINGEDLCFRRSKLYKIMVNGGDVTKPHQRIRGRVNDFSRDVKSPSPIPFPEGDDFDQCDYDLKDDDSRSDENFKQKMDKMMKVICGRTKKKQKLEEFYSESESGELEIDCESLLSKLMGDDYATLSRIGINRTIKE